MRLKTRFWIAQRLLGCPEGWLFDAMWMLPFETSVDERKQRKDNVRRAGWTLGGEPIPADLAQYLKEQIAEDGHIMRRVRELYSIVEDVEARLYNLERA